MPASPDPQELLAPILSGNAMAWLTQNLQGDLLEAFLADVKPGMHDLIDVAMTPSTTMEDTMAALTSIVETVETWYVSFRLAASSMWQKQMSDSDYTVNDLGNGSLVPQTVDEIFASLRS